MDPEKLSASFEQFKILLKNILDDYDARIAALQAEKKKFLNDLQAMVAGDTGEPQAEAIPQTASAQARKPTAPDRLRSANASYKGKGAYSRGEFYNTVNADGHGVMPPGTFAPVFAQMVKDKEIKEVADKKGSQSALYCHPDDYESVKAQQSGLL